MEVEEYDIKDEKFFSEEYIEDLLDNDEITAEEAGFLTGYQDEE